MEIFNIGIIEAVFILALMLVLLGPDGMMKTARSVAVAVRKFLHSPLWMELKQSLGDIQEMPNRLIKEAGFDDINREIQELNAPIRGAKAWNPYPPGDMSIQPPAAKEAASHPSGSGATSEKARIEDPTDEAAAQTLPETPRQVYKRSTAALRKTRQPVIYPQRVILPPNQDATNRRDHN